MGRARAEGAAELRRARRQLLEVLGEEPSFVKGSLVTMARSCGRAGCRCQRGEKHVSLYLAVRHRDKRKMIYIPPALEEKVRALVGAGQRIECQLGAISRVCLEQLLEEKARGQ